MRAIDDKTPPVPREDALKKVSPVPTQDVAVNWKRALSEVLCKSEERISLERSWGRLCKRLRELCPETNWIFISDEQVIPNEEGLKALNGWLEGLIADPTWPFPPQVIFTSECVNKELSWKILFSGDIKDLPFFAPPHSLTITPYHDQHCNGWHIRQIDSYTISQAGEA